MPQKFIFVSGGVLSGLGKGVTAASIAFLLQQRGYKVTPVKCENYINLDSGLINPIEHGDPFLCDDGTEADMDMGTYEKFLNKNVGKHNFITMGQIYQNVIKKEREFKYEGEDVEAVPHVTDEIISRIREAGRKENADIVVIELGGTAGEYQNALYYEASRILKLVHKDIVIHVHVSYLPTPPHLGEPKTKPTQLSVRYLNSMGIQPDFILCRSEKTLDKRRRQRLAMFCNVETEEVINNPDEKTIYQVPLTFHNQNLDVKILQKMAMPTRNLNLKKWEDFIKGYEEIKTEIRVAIVGKYFTTGDYQLRDSYAALFDALDHGAFSLGVDVKTHWIDAEKVESAFAKASADKEASIEKIIGKPDGLIIPIGWGERGAEGMIEAASFARKTNIPYLGLCYGMQLAVIAFARDILGWKDANTNENNIKTKHPVIHLMPAQKKYMEKRAYGGTLRLGAWEAKVKKGTKAFEIYGTENTSERHRHRFEFNDEFTKDFEKKGLVISARSVVENLAEIMELPKSIHPFYFGTQGHPEYKSRPLSPHPIFLAFLNACKKGV